MEERKMCHVGRYVTDTLAQSYLPMTSQTTGAAAEVAADRKTAKDAPLTQSYLFVPIAVETMGAINRVGKKFLSDLGRRITQMTNDKRKGAFLFQRLSMVIYPTVQRGRHPGHLCPHIA